MLTHLISFQRKLVFQIIVNLMAIHFFFLLFIFIIFLRILIVAFKSELLCSTTSEQLVTFLLSQL